MNGPHSTQPLPPAVLDAAIDWSIKLRYNQPDPQTKIRFEQWFNANPLHQLAWQRMEAVHTTGRSLRADEHHADNAPLSSKQANQILNKARTLQSQHSHKRTTLHKLLVLVGVGGLTGIGVQGVRQHTPWQRLIADTSTSTGEQKNLLLQDGGSLLLNTDTAISMAFDANQRSITLHRGEIQITTGKDGAQRPFWVHTPYGKLQALGTRFIVRLEPRESRAYILVTEGAVALTPARENTAQHTVQTGEQYWLTSTSAQPAASQALDPQAWISGTISGQNIPMPQLLAELNRYRPGRITWSEGIASLNVSGTFHVQAPEKVLHLLQKTHPIQMARFGYWLRVSRL